MWKVEWGTNCNINCNNCQNYMSHVLHIIVTNKITLCEKYACFASQNYESSHISEDMFVVFC